MKFYKSKEEVINFFRDYIEMLSDANYDAKIMKLREKDLRYQHLNKYFKDYQ